MMMMIAVSKILLSSLFHLLKTNDPISMFHLEFLKKSNTKAASHEAWKVTHTFAVFSSLKK